jgi:hypothetical protein
MPPKKVFVLAPSDVKPGSIDPQGRVVKQATLYANNKGVVVGVEFEDGTSGAYMWPNGSGWTVDGRKAP